MRRGAAAVVLCAAVLAGCGAERPSQQAASVDDGLPETVTSIPTALPVRDEHHGMMMPANCPKAGQAIIELR
jgi:ABC-type glycerol-3-phosphate transport system substrate-binding protein